MKTKFIQETQLKTVASSLDSRASLLEKLARPSSFACSSFNQSTFLLSSCATVKGQPRTTRPGRPPMVMPSACWKPSKLLPPVQETSQSPPFTVLAVLMISPLPCNTDTFFSLEPRKELCVCHHRNSGLHSGSAPWRLSLQRVPGFRQVLRL